LNATQIIELPRAVRADVCAGYVSAALATDAWKASNISAIDPTYSRSQVRIAVDMYALTCVAERAAPRLIGDRRLAGLVTERTLCFRYLAGE